MSISSAVPAENMWHFENRIIGREFSEGAILKCEEEDIEP